MPNLEPKSFLSFHFNFISLKSLFFIPFTKILSFSSYPFFILVLFGIFSTFCEATYQFKYKPFYNDPGELLLHRRVPRSPFLPPTVTSFKPSIRKSTFDRNKLNGKINESRVNVVPPFVVSQSSQSSPSLKNKNPEQIPKIPQSKLISPVKVLYPRPPMIVPYIKNEEPKINNTREEFSVTPQNDQHSVTLQEKQKETHQKDVIKSNEENVKNESREEIEKNPEPKTMNHEKGFAGLNEVLEALDIKIEDLNEVLKRINIPMENFLDFIDKEKTKDEIMAYLKLPESLKYNSRTKKVNSPNFYKTTKSIPYSTGNSYDHKYNRVDRQKALVDHLPITEIVHEVPLDSQVTYRSDVSHKSQSGRTPSYKNDKRSSDNQFGEKKYKSKRNKNNHTANPFLMNSDSTMYPPKDSPIIIPFLPARRKQTKPTESVKGSASIVSMTVEETVISGSSDSMHETTLPIRNKVMSKDEGETRFSKTDKPWNQSSYEQQQANLRLVFPMRGILMFCGSLGIVAVVTIIMLIIYGTVKCNQKPTSSTYELSEHQEGSTSSVLTNT